MRSASKRFDGSRLGEIKCDIELTRIEIYTGGRAAEDYGECTKPQNSHIMGILPDCCEILSMTLCKTEISNARQFVCAYFCCDLRTTSIERCDLLFPKRKCILKRRAM